MSPARRSSWRSPDGGENALHSHEGQDGLYFCLIGLLHFYGENDVLLAELKQYQGIVIPGGYKYRLKAAGDEEVHMLQIAAFDRSRGNKHTSCGPPASKENTFSILVLDGELPTQQTMRLIMPSTPAFSQSPPPSRPYP